MKNLILIIFLATSISASGQFPDSLDVQLPWVEVYAESCNQEFGIGPTTESSSVVIGDLNESYVDFTSTGCIKVFREWGILDLESGVLYGFTQTVNINSAVSFGTIENFSIPFDGLPATYDVTDFIIDPDPNHIYSFSPFDEEDNTITFDMADESTTVTVAIYEHTNKAVNDVKVFLSDCQEDVVIDIPENVLIAFDGQHYIKFTEELLGIEISYPCTDYTVSIFDGSNTGVFSSAIGQTKELQVLVLAEDDTEFISSITAVISGNPPPVIPMYIEEKSFTAGEIFTLDIWSDEIESLAAWQFRLNFEDAEILEITEGAIFDNIPHNILNNNMTINTLWIPLDAQPISAEFNETWFTLTILPAVDGSTFDVFTTENDPWSSIVIQDSFDLLDLDVDFSFQVAERNFLVSNNNVTESKLVIHNNPVVDRLVVSGFENTTDNAQLSIYTIEGEMVKNQKINTQSSILDMDVSSFASGLYFLSFKDGDKLRNIKFFKK